jgi:hypothetical protein
MTTDRGTFCVVIKEQLAVSYCPLPSGVCMWKHRVHGMCTYSEEFSNTAFSPNEYALHVGLSPISGDIVNILKRTVVAKIKDELSK